MYGNGVLLLGVVCIPFTTFLLGVFVLTNAATPAVAWNVCTLSAAALNRSASAIG